MFAFVSLTFIILVVASSINPQRTLVLKINIFQVICFRGTHLWVILFSQHQRIHFTLRCFTNSFNLRQQTSLFESLKGTKNQLFTRFNLCIYVHSRFNHAQSFQVFIQSTSLMLFFISCRGRNLKVEMCFRVFGW